MGYMDSEEIKKVMGTENKSLEEELGIKKIYHGEALNKAIEEVKEERVALIEGFLYERNILGIVGADGEGKSHLALQLALEGSCGKNVWNGLIVPKPFKTIWLAGERPLDEPFERMKAVKDKIPYDVNNLVIDDTIKSLDLTIPEHRATMFIRLMQIASVWPNGKPDLVIIDPLYSIVCSDLISARDVWHINSFLKRIQTMFDCAIIFVHHTNRGTKDENGTRRGADMYGSRFLSANLTGLYQFVKGKDTGELVRIKTSYSNLVQKIPLIWDSISQTASLSKDATDYNKADRLRAFLRKQFDSRRDFTLSDIADRMMVHDSYIRKCLKEFFDNGSVINLSQQGQKAIYRVVKQI